MELQAVRRKDPSDLYIQCGKDEAAEKVKSALKDAKRIDLADLAASIPVAIKDARCICASLRASFTTSRVSTSSTRKRPSRSWCAAHPSSSPSA